MHVNLYAPNALAHAQSVTPCADNPHTLGNLVTLKFGSSSITSLFPSAFSYLSIISATRREIITIDSSCAPPPSRPAFM